MTDDMVWPLTLACMVSLAKVHTVCVVYFSIRRNWFVINVLLTDLL